MIDPYAQGLLLLSFVEEHQQKANLERMLFTQKFSTRQRVMTLIGDLLIRTGTFIQQQAHDNLNHRSADIALEVK